MLLMLLKTRKFVLTESGDLVNLELSARLLHLKTRITRLSKVKR